MTNVLRYTCDPPTDESLVSGQPRIIVKLLTKVTLLPLCPGRILWLVSLVAAAAGQDGPLDVDKLEHGLGADLEDDPRTVPLSGVVNDHGEAEVEKVSGEAPGEIGQRPWRYLGVHPVTLH